MLLRRQAEPGGKLSARPELVGISDGGGDGGCCDNAKAGDRSEPATGLAVDMPRVELAIQRRDFFGKRHDLPDQDLQRRTGIGWQSILVGQRLLRQLCQVGDSGVGDETELRQMRSQNGKETLGGSGRFETLHLALAPSCRLMRILGPVVRAQALVMASRQSNFGLRRAVRAQFVRY